MIDLKVFFVIVIIIAMAFFSREPPMII